MWSRYGIVGACNETTHAKPAQSHAARALQACTQTMPTYISTQALCISPQALCISQRPQSGATPQLELLCIRI